jgi:hypothetical protein
VGLKLKEAVSVVPTVMVLVATLDPVAFVAVRVTVLAPAVV